MAVFLSGAQNLAGGASHDGLDIAKMGGKRIRRFGKVGVLGRGGIGWKEGRNVQRWADMALQVDRLAGEADRQGAGGEGEQGRAVLSVMVVMFWRWPGCFRLAEGVTAV